MVLMDMNLKDRLHGIETLHLMEKTIYIPVSKSLKEKLLNR